MCINYDLSLMSKYLLLTYILLGVFITSCIPHKDIVYYQNKENGLDSTFQVTEAQKPYRIQINDILNIRIKVLDQDNVEIFNPTGDGDLDASSMEKSYFDGFTVDLHGDIRIPTLGKINVLGYTSEEIEELIKHKLLEEQFKETANIFVTVKLTGLTYTASGEITSPGTNTIFKERVNIFEAIANSGEIPITGDISDVMIIRQYPQGQQIHHLDLTDVNVMNSPYYYLQPNDIIYVKPRKQKTWGTGTTGRESLATIVSIVSVATATILLITRL